MEETLDSLSKKDTKINADVGRGSVEEEVFDEVN